MECLDMKQIYQWQTNNDPYPPDWTAHPQILVDTFCRLLKYNFHTDWLIFVVSQFVILYIIGWHKRIKTTELYAGRQDYKRSQIQNICRKDIKKRLKERNCF